MRGSDTDDTTRSEPRAFVHEAVVDLVEDADPRAVGAAVTVALCGHWEHEGPCRWPHHNEIVDGLFRTLFVCGADEEPEVRSRIRSALGGASHWRVVTERARPVADAERSLAQSLLTVPRRS
jgi:hypothetical protein